MNDLEKAIELSKEGFDDLSNPFVKVTTILIKDRCLNMAQWKDEQLKQTREDAKSLYDEISDCIDKLVKSRLSKNGIGESNALQQMESIMVQTQQFLQTI